MFKCVYKGKTNDGNERLFFKKNDWIDNTLEYYVDIKSGIKYFKCDILLDTLVSYDISDIDIEKYKVDNKIEEIKILNKKMLA